MNNNTISINATNKEPPVTVRVYIFEDEAVGTEREKYLAMRAIHTMDLSSPFLLFMKLVIDEGYELDQGRVGYLRLFQVYTEILIILAYDLADSGYCTESPDLTIIDELIMELTSTTHGEFLHGISIEPDTVADILAIAKEVGLHQLIKASEIGNIICTPTLWVSNSKQVILHLAIIK